MTNSRRLLPSVVAVLVVGTAILAAVAPSPRLRRSASRARRALASRWRPPPPLPAILPEHLRQVEELARRRAARDPAGEAAVAASLGGEAITRADRVAALWLTARVPPTGLLPRRLPPEGEALWNGADVASDLFGHLAIEAELFGTSRRAAVREILAAERRLSGPLPAAIDLSTGRRVEQEALARLFGAIEFAKDGLLPLVELTGDGPWRDRLLEIVDEVIAAAPVPSRFGPLPAAGAEKNGEVLQVLARISRRAATPARVGFARRVADAYAFEVLPRNDDLPAEVWDFARHRAVSRRVRLRDHGNEMIAGLVEWQLAEEELAEGDPERYRPAVERMLKRLLSEGRLADGGWRSRLVPGDPQVPSVHEEPNDNWGYLSMAIAAYGLSLPAGNPLRDELTSAARGALRSAAAGVGTRWEGGHFDGWADSLEGAIGLLATLGDPGGEAWVDREVGRLFAFQQADGRIDGSYLDGNFVRTALLYALWKSRGTRADPWRPGVRLGAAPLSRGGVALHLESPAPWVGVVRFDTPRSREHLGLARPYPRLNGWPEWFVVEREALYEIARDGEAPRRRRGGELLGGLSVDLPAGGVARWTIRPLAPIVAGADVVDSRGPEGER